MYGKGKAHIHPAGVAFYRGIDEAIDFGEGDDLIELARDFGAAHSHDRAAQLDIFAPGQLRMETGADLEQATDTAVKFDPSGGRFGDARKHLEQGRFAGAIASDDAEHLTRRHFEIYVAQGPYVARVGSGRPIGEARAQSAPRRRDRPRDRIAKGAIRLALPDPVALAKVFDFDNRPHQKLACVSSRFEAPAAAHRHLAPDP